MYDAPKLYRKKPITVEAMELAWATKSCLLQWLRENEVSFVCFPEGVVIVTLEGNMKATWGDYIIKGVYGEFYPCKPDIFKLTYEVDARKSPTTRQEWR